MSSLCRGGFLTAADPAGQAAALADNRAAILEAAALGTTELFLVVGGLAPGEKDVVAARQRVAERLADLVPVRRRTRRPPGARAAAPDVLRRTGH